MIHLRDTLYDGDFVGLGRAMMDNSSDICPAT
jgi:hypothetical protein